MKQHPSIAAIVSERFFCVQLKKLTKTKLKKFIVPLIILAIAFALPEQVFAQAPDSCLRLFCDPTLCYNPDSVMVDTCSSSSTHGRMYCKLGFEVEFDSGSISLGYGAPDSILEVGWEAINPAFSSLRNALEGIYNNRGAYVLRKIFPQDTLASSRYSRRFLIRFIDYTLVDSVMSDLSATEDIVFWEFHKPKIPNETVSHQVIKSNQSDRVHIDNRHVWVSDGDSSYSIRTVYIYSAQGGLIFEKKVYGPASIEIASLGQGSYYVIVDSDMVGKFIVVR